MDVDSPGMHTVVDVGGPDSCGEEEQLKGQEVHGHEEEHPAVRKRLQAPKGSLVAVPNIKVWVEFGDEYQHRCCTVGGASEDCTKQQQLAVCNGIPKCVSHCYAGLRPGYIASPA